ncbi:hypothetical protein ILUMI_13995 [Ignelater luminosus]|uniref:Uncharacterized protein n=1 Tax=Ignelater luminosus TaxID=2038154 RepID=A0A8K0CR93_IGNLU|nr:hypothetical protein ILUMI_13995 [Ignelater luminosus]
MGRNVRSQHPPPNSLDELRQSPFRVRKDIPKEITMRINQILEIQEAKVSDRPDKRDKVHKQKKTDKK